MSTELGVLGLYGLVVVATIVIEVLLAIPKLGFPYLLGPRDEARTLDGVAGRAARCAQNSIFALALFAPAALSVHVLGLSTASTVLAAQIFLAARVIYVPVYLAGVPLLRTGVWAVAALAVVYLYLAVI